MQPPGSHEIDLATALPEATSKRLTTKQLAGLEALGVKTIGDLITHYPRRYEDRTRFGLVPTGPSEVPVCLKMEVVDTGLRRLGGKRTIFEAVVDQGESSGGVGLGGTLVLRWFNLTFMSKVIAVGQELVVYGKTKQSGRRLVIDHPDIEIIDPDDPAAQRIHLDRITPVYPLASGINQRTLRGLVFEILEKLTDDVLPDLLDPPPAWVVALKLWRGRALRQIHFPESEELLAEARRYLALEEFVALQINVLQRRAEYDAKGGVARPSEGLLLKDLIDSLPFQLTGAQLRCVEEIRADLASSRPMNRLLQGDVGSGKTLVALSGMLLAVEAGYQAALMAPTQILAEQHYLGIQRLLEPLDIRVSLRTGAKHEDGFLPLMAGGEAQIIIGTHALIHDKVDFQNLGFVVVDEQHKFGVAQRGKLIEQGHAPDVLVMTATPIPRTLTLSIYGDLDVSIIDELPAGRGKIITGIRGIDKTEKAAAFVRDQLEENRQAYIVYPLIEESEKVKSLAASVEFDKWVKRFEHFECGLIHGRMAPPEKEQVMKDFREGRLDVLVATTVIEVGVDVPNANVMLIYNAERFGLAQLHQLRGRIGRGAHKSYCVLMIDAKNSEAMHKLQVMEQTTDGFQIADADLKIRGPGEVLGTAQSGMPDLKLGDLVTDTELVKEAREIAAEILRSDPNLKASNHQMLASRFAGGERAAGQLS